jgi:transcriptional regulator with XRE-family HTH domain
VSPLIPNTVRCALGRRVSEIRNERGMTQRQLADAMRHRGVNYVVRVEAGQVNLTIDQITKLANALRTSVESLFVRPRTTHPRRPGRPKKFA